MVFKIEKCVFSGLCVYFGYGMCLMKIDFMMFLFLNGKLKKMYV